MDAFIKTELFSSVATHPNLADLTPTDCAVMEELTGVARGFFCSNRDRPCLPYGRRVSLQGGAR